MTYTREPREQKCNFLTNNFQMFWITYAFFQNILTCRLVIITFSLLPGQAWIQSNFLIRFGLLLMNYWDTNRKAPFLPNFLLTNEMSIFIFKIESLKLMKIFPSEKVYVRSILVHLIRIFVVVICVIQTDNSIQSHYEDNVLSMLLNLLFKVLCLAS